MGFVPAENLVGKAQIILLREAGGVATSPDGSPLDLHGQNVCVSNGAVQDALMEVLNHARDSVA